jgi:hypothetical protein
MYQIIKKISRPDETVEIPVLSLVADPAHWDHFISNYELTGKHIFRDAVDTPSERTVTIYWSSKESSDEFDNDPIMQQMRNAHAQLLASLGLTSVTVSETEI